MGNCCGSANEEGNVAITKGGFKTQQGFTQLFDDREVCGLRGTDKLKLIVKIQVNSHQQLTAYNLLLGSVQRDSSEEEGQTDSRFPGENYEWDENIRWSDQ